MHPLLALLACAEPASTPASASPPAPAPPAWTRSELLAPPVDAPSLALAGGVPHVVAAQFGSQGMKLGRLEAGAWTFEPVGEALRAVVRADPKGRLHIAGTRMHLAAMRIDFLYAEAGEPFETVASGCHPVEGLAELLFERDGTPLMVYRCEQTLRVQRRTKKGWVTTASVDAVFVDDAAIDSRGAVHMLWNVPTGRDEYAVIADGDVERHALPDGFRADSVAVCDDRVAFGAYTREGPAILTRIGEEWSSEAVAADPTNDSVLLTYDEACTPVVAFDGGVYAKSEGSWMRLPSLNVLVDRIHEVAASEGKVHLVYTWTDRHGSNAAYAVAAYGSR